MAFAEKAFQGKRRLQEPNSQEGRDADSIDGKGGIKAQEAKLTSALLMEAAEIETRLRQHIIELVEPSLRRTRILEGGVQEVKGMLDGHTDDILELKKSQSGSENLMSQIDGFRVELAGWDKERRGHEQQIGDRLTLQEAEMNAMRESIERRSNEHASTSRTLKTMTDLVTNIKIENHDVRRFCIDRCDANVERIRGLRNEIEMRELAVETEQHHMRDCQTRLDTAIEHMKSEMQLMKANLHLAVKAVEDLKEEKAPVTCVEKQQEEFAEFVKQVDSQVSGLRGQFGSLVEEVKTHFETAANTLGISTAKQMEHMQEQYHDEVHRTSSVLKELDGFVDRQKRSLDSIDKEVKQARVQAEGRLENIEETLQSYSQQRDLDAATLNIEIAQLRKGLKDVESKSSGVGGGAAGRSDIIEMLVESALLGAALDGQDDQDRRNVALYGFKVEGKQDKGCSLPNLEGKQGKGGSRLHTPRRKAGGNPETIPTGGGTHEAPVMSLDKRCLSCSGSAATVLAGFKLACLQYHPSPVEYQKVSYSRAELIRLRGDLLSQVKEQLKSMK